MMGLMLRQTDLLGTGSPHWHSRRKLLAWSVLLSQKERDGDQYGTGRKESHQNPIGLKKLGFGRITDRYGDTKGDSRADNL
jgi:hypothetical protein